MLGLWPQCQQQNCSKANWERFSLSPITYFCFLKQLGLATLKAAKFKWFFLFWKRKKNDFIAKVIIFSLVSIFQYLIQLWVLPPQICFKCFIISHHEFIHPKSILGGFSFSKGFFRDTVRFDITYCCNFPFGLLLQNTRDRVAYKHQKFILKIWRLEVWGQSTSMVGFWWRPFFRFHTADVSCTLTWWRDEGALWGPLEGHSSCSRGLHPHDLITS